MAYLLDADVFIQAKNLHYQMDIFEGFWQWIDIAHSDGRLLSVDAVRKELLQREDKLSTWCRTRKKMFASTKDGKTYESFGLLATWVNENYQPAFQAKFFKNADFTLVGHAHAYDHVVVTYETPANGYDVKIPNACFAMNVEVIKPAEMLSRENVRFDLRR